MFKGRLLSCSDELLENAMGRKVSDRLRSHPRARKIAAKNPKALRRRQHKSSALAHIKHEARAFAYEWARFLVTRFRILVHTSAGSSGAQRFVRIG